MPYITQDKRPSIDNLIELVACNNAGELNYAITTLVLKYVNEEARMAAKLSYGLINEVMGVLECAKQELYRRLAAPYEDDKIIENGDVYTTLISDALPKEAELCSQECIGISRANLLAALGMAIENFKGTSMEDCVLARKLTKVYNSVVEGAEVIIE